MLPDAMPQSRWRWLWSWRVLQPLPCAPQGDCPTLPATLPPAAAGSAPPSRTALRTLPPTSWPGVLSRPPRLAGTSILAAGAVFATQLPSGPFPTRRGAPSWLVPRAAGMVKHMHEPCNQYCKSDTRYSRLDRQPCSHQQPHPVRFSSAFTALTTLACEWTGGCSRLQQNP